MEECPPSRLPNSCTCAVWKWRSSSLSSFHLEMTTYLEVPSSPESPSSLNRLAARQPGSSLVLLNKFLAAPRKASGSLETKLTTALTGVLMVVDWSRRRD